jgi:hypothetical protein
MVVAALLGVFGVRWMGAVYMIDENLFLERGGY